MDWKYLLKEVNIQCVFNFVQEYIRRGKKERTRERYREFEEFFTQFTVASDTTHTRFGLIVYTVSVVNSRQEMD